MTNIFQRLDAHAIPELEVFDRGTELNNNAGTLVSRAFGVEEGHGREGPVVGHEVHVGHAEARGVEADEDFVGL